MEEEQMQPNTEQDMTPEEAKASLGIATMLQQQHLDSQAIEQPVEGEETQEMPQGEDQTEDMQDIDSKVKMAVDEQLADIRDQIKQAISEEEPEGGGKDDGLKKELDDLKSMFKELMQENKSFKKELKDALK